MQEKLLIYFNVRHPERPSWAVIDADGVTRRYAYHDSVDGLAQLADAKEVIAIVPSEDVSHTTVKLPKMNRSRLLQAIPYALEDQLISDVEALHFAPGDFQPDTDLSVAVVAREKMQRWLDLLQSWGIQADKLIPTVFTVPYSEGEWHVMVDEMSILRTAPLLGMACDNNNLDALLRIALASASPQPKQIIIRNYTAHPFAEALNLATPIMEEHVAPEQMMLDVTRSVLNTPSINLLQADFASKKTKLPTMDAVQRIVYRLVIAVVVLLFLYPLGSLLILSQRTNDIKDQVNAIYRKNFPQATSVTAPKIRMEEKLRKLNTKINENRLLMLMGYVGKGLSETKNVKLKRLDYQGSQLTLELTATTSDDLSNFTDFLTQQGLRVNQQNATLLGTRVNATLQIE